MQRGEVLRSDAFEKSCSRVTFSNTWDATFFIFSLWRFVFRLSVAVRSMSLSDVFRVGEKTSQTV